MVARRCTRRGGPGRRPTRSPSWPGSWASPRSGPGPRSTASSPPASWSGPTHAIAFPEPPSRPSTPGSTTPSAAAAGSLAIPRRILRYLADGARPALIATALGVLLRCLSRRREASTAGAGSRPPGSPGPSASTSAGSRRPAASWSPSAGSRPRPTDQWAMNRWGRAYRIDLAWGPAVAPAGRRSPPPPARPGPDSSPPVFTRNPFRREIKPGTRPRRAGWG